MRNLIKNILKESEDEFDWIREVPLHVPFEQAVIGKKYKIETTEVLREALEACGEEDWLYYSPEAELIRSGLKEYDDVFCDHYREDRVFALRLNFYHKSSNYYYPRAFWVTEDMVKLYEII